MNKSFAGVVLKRSCRPKQCFQRLVALSSYTLRRKKYICLFERNYIVLIKKIWFTGSVIPIINRDRRPSITIERPTSRHRPSISVLDRPLPLPRYRRSSCFLERPNRSHRNFISFDQHSSSNSDRKTPITIEVPSSTSNLQPTISFEVETSSSKKHGKNSTFSSLLQFFLKVFRLS